MEMELFNNGYYTAEVCIDSGEYVKIPPFSHISLQCMDGCEFDISVRRDTISHKKKYMYVLEIETRYKITNYSGGVINIICEQDKIRHNIYYERMYLYSDNAEFVPRAFDVYGKKEIVSAFNKSRLYDFFVFEPLMHLFGITGIFIIVLGIYLSYTFSLRVSFLYFFTLYCLEIGMQLFVDYVWNRISKNVFKVDDEKTEFYNYFDKDFIYKYYAEKR